MTIAAAGTTRELASFLSDLRFEDLPAKSWTVPRSFSLDWIASALAGRNARPVRILELFASMMGPYDSPSEILISRWRTSPLFAALVNGAASHYQVFRTTGTTGTVAAAAEEIRRAIDRALDREPDVRDLLPGV